jgi:mono/diheme cytochrome c family protein
VLALVSAIGSTADLEAQAKAAVAPADMVARGKYLVTTGACEDCHTPWAPTPKGPPAPDPARMLSGHPASLKLTPPPRLPDGWGMVASATNTAFAGAWGVSYAANLTPDKETGLGNWTEEMFIGALRKGHHAGAGRPILPPMPWPAYAQMSDQDLKAMFAYLRSIKPIKNAVPSPAPPMPAP